MQHLPDDIIQQADRQRIREQGPQTKNKLRIAENDGQQFFKIQPSERRNLFVIKRPVPQVGEGPVGKGIRQHGFIQPKRPVHRVDADAGPDTAQADQD